MKITWETGEENEDQNKIKRMIHADDAFSSLYDVGAYLREQWKYADEPDDIDKIRERFTDILYENGIILDNLWS